MIEGELVRLREARTQDETVLASIRNDLSVQRNMLARARPNTPERVRAWVSRMHDDTGAVFFAVATTVDDEPVGYVQISKIDTVSRVGWLGVCIAPSAQGKGYGREAVKRIEQYVREVFGLRKVALEVLAENTAARGMYEKLGYRTVGTMEKHFAWGDEILDVVVMEHLL